MKVATHIRLICGFIVLLTAANGVCSTAEKPKALLLACSDTGAVTAALRDTGLDVIEASPASTGALPPGVRLVVLGADAAFDDDQAARLAAFVRAGGELLVVHTADDPNYWWDTYRRTGAGPPKPSPLWDVLPFVSVPMADQTHQGIRNPFGPTHVLRQAESPLLAGVDLTQAPAFPRHGFMVLPTHSLVQTANVMFAWSEDQYKSPLWGNGQVLAWGDDPEQRPLLLIAEYGAGRCAAAAVPLFDKAFMAWPGSRVLLRNLTAWLAVEAQPTAPVTVEENKVYGVGLPWIARDSFDRMGLPVTDRPEGATGAVVYGVPTASQAQAIAELARAGKPVVVANPAALRVRPLDQLVPLGQAATTRTDRAAAARAPQMVVDTKLLWNKRELRECVWALDSESVGEAQGWFTVEGAAAAKWQEGIEGLQGGDHPEKKATPAAGAKRAAPRSAQPKRSATTADAANQVASWSKTYRWRLEGSLLDRRDLIEGWQQAALDDSTWAEQTLGQDPPPPQVAGVKAPAQNLLAGALWARARLTLRHPETSGSTLAPSSDPAFVTLLDGKPLRQPVALRTLTAGEHLVALRIWPVGRMSSNVSENPWGTKAKLLEWPQLVESPDARRAAATQPRSRVWVKAAVRLPADAKWNALQIDDASDALLYVNGRRVAVAATGIHHIAWKTGDNMLVFGNLDRPSLPSCRLAVVPTGPAAVGVLAAERLEGVWYMRDDRDHQALSRGWPAALKDAVPPEGWTAVAADAKQGIVARVDDERPRWFAAPFLVTEREAAGPARLVIDTTGEAVPTDLIKDVWLNGQRVPARIEFAATQRYELDRGKQTLLSFVLSGRLKAGLNWLAFPLDFQEYYRLRLAVPSRQGHWLVPLAKLDFSGRLDEVTWTEPLGRLGGGGLVHRGDTVAPPAGATVLAQFSDGVPAVARVGNVTFATSDQLHDWSRWIEEAVRYDWVVLKDGETHFMAGMQLKQRNHAAGDPVQADGAQVAASLLRGTPAIVGVEPAADSSAVVRVASGQQPRLFGYQWRNWMGMVLAEGRLAVPLAARCVAVPAPAADPSPMTTHLRGDRWLRVALLDGRGAAVRDYLEARVDARPAVEVLLAPTDGSQRDLPAAIAGAADYDPANSNWSLAAESPASPVVVPGERIQLRAMCRNTTAQPQQAALDLAWEGALEAKPVALGALRFTLAAYEQRTELLPCGFRLADMRFQALASSDPAPLRAMPAGAQPQGALATGRVVARAGQFVAGDVALIAVRPWKQFAPNSAHRLPGQCGAPGGFEMAQFFRAASWESLADPLHRWWNQETGGNYVSAIDWWRDHFVNTHGNGGGFGGFNGKKDFAWGPFDQVWEMANMALDNAGYLPDGTQYQEMLYAGISREYNRFTRGTQPLHMEMADYWANFNLPNRERNCVQFLRWRRDRGRPLNVTTAAELADLRQHDPAVADDWQKFAEEGYVAWSSQCMAGLPPGSINASQGESMHFLFGRLHDNLDAIRAVLRASNMVFYQPMDLGRRGELHFGWMRAMCPELLLLNEYWCQTTGNAQTAGHSFGSGGSLLTSPEVSRLGTLDNGLMAVRDDAGKTQPMVNMPLNDERLPERGRLALLGERRGGKGSLLPELVGRDITDHLCALIQPERLLGYFVVTPLERPAKDKLDGAVVDLRAKTDEQPVMGLTHVLRNYGALWGGVIAPDRVNKIQPGEGALYVMPSGTGDAEANPLIDLVRRGGAASLFFSTGGTKTQETALSELFGVKYAPVAKDAQGTMQLRPNGPEQPYVAEVYGAPQYVSTGQGRATDLIEGNDAIKGRALLRTVEAGEGRAVFSSMNANLSWGWDHELARKLAQAVNWAAGNPVTLPDGVGGYAFEAKGMTFLVLEDLKYTGGPAEIHVKLPAGNYQAADLFSGLPVNVESRADGIIIRPTLLPNGGSLIVVRKADSASEK